MEVFQGLFLVDVKYRSTCIYKRPRHVANIIQTLSMIPYKQYWNSALTPWWPKLGAVRARMSIFLKDPGAIEIHLQPYQHVIIGIVHKLGVTDYVIL